MRAQLLVVGGEVDAACDLFRWGVRYYPAAGEMWNNHAICLINKGAEPSDVIAAIQRAKEQLPSNQQIASNADIITARGNSTAAVAVVFVF